MGEAVSQSLEQVTLAEHEKLAAKIKASAGEPVVVVKGHPSQFIEQVPKAYAGFLTGRMEVRTPKKAGWENPSTFARAEVLAGVLNPILLRHYQTNALKPIGFATDYYYEEATGLECSQSSFWLSVASFARDYRRQNSNEGEPIIREIGPQDLLIGKEAIEASPYFELGISSLMQRLDS